MKIIAVRGQKQSGKDTVQNILFKLLADRKVSVVKKAFAYPGKKAASIIFDLPESLLFGSDEDKSQPTTIKWSTIPQWVRDTHGNPNPDSYLKIRDVLTSFLTEAIKSVYGPDVWVNWMFRQIQAAEAQGIEYFLITDCRFDNEAEAITSWGGQVWLITGRGGNTETHSSESETRGTTRFTAIIDNSVPGPDHVVLQIKKLLGA